MLVVVRELGASDCEAFGEGLLLQPVNSVSSLAYAAVGAAIAVAAWRSGRPEMTSNVYAACLVFTGIGSFLYHGPQTTGSELLHDLPISLLVAVVMLHDARVLGTRWVADWPSLAIVGVVLTAITWISPEAAAALTGAFVAVVGVEEVLIHRRDLRPGGPSRNLRRAAVVTAAFAVAGALWALGRSSGPLCRPDSALQLHGLWHVASAAGFGLWWWWAMPGRSASGIRRTASERA